MILSLILATIAGICIGTVTGLVPGIHINLVTAFIQTSLVDQELFSALTLAASIIAISIAHTCADYISAVYVGAPEEETALTVLPAHRLLMKGEAQQAILLLLGGTIAGLALTALTIPLVLTYAQQADTLFRPAIPIILGAVSIYMILREKNPFIGALIWLLAGFLGYITFHTPLEDPLFPLLTGLFGLSGLIVSSQTKVKIPLQKPGTLRGLLPRKEALKGIVGGTIIGIPASLLPALGSGYATTVNAEITEPSEKGFLFMNGLFTTLTLGTSFILIYAVGKARTGAAAALGDVLANPSQSEAIALITVAIITLALSVTITLVLSKQASKIISRINYARLSKIILLFLFAAVAYRSGAYGIIVAATGGAIGIIAIKKGVKRLHLMGALLLPTIIWYLFN